MVKQGNKSISNAAVCSILRSRPRRICRYGSRASLDVKSSFVQKKIWLFEGANLKDFQFDSDDHLSDRDTARDKSCRNHSWFLFTNLSTSQQCAKCMKRILPHRASYKCSACKQICHLKCAIKPEYRPTLDNNTEDSDTGVVNSNNMDDDDAVDFDEMDTQEMTEPAIVPKHHRQTRNAARLRKQILDESTNGEEDIKKKSDLNTSIQSQAKQKFSSMKHNIVKRCKSIKKKVQKKKRETDSQVDNNNNNSVDNDQDDIDATTQADQERDAWLQSPIRTRLRSRRVELEKQYRRSSSHTNDESPPSASNITERRKRSYKHQSGRTRVRRFLHDYDLTVKQILDRLDIVEEKIKHLQTAIPVEISKWKTLQGRYREDSFTQIDSVPLSSIDSEIPINHETNLKHLEAENNLPSLSSGTASDEVFLVKDKSSSSHEFVEPIYAKTRKLTKQEALDIGGFPEDSLPSGIPLRLRTDMHIDCVDHQTSTPVTERDLTFFKHSNRSHSIKHTNVTNIRLDTSGGMNRSKTDKPDFDTSRSPPQRKVLSPEQLGVKHFLNRRRKSSPLKQNQSADRSGIYEASPIASSTFRQGEDWLNQSQTSPFSFTIKNDYVDHSKASFTKVGDDSETECPKQNASHQNCSSNLSFTFRNDSQLIQNGEDEDLPGFTINHPFHPTEKHQDHRHINLIPTTFDKGEKILHYREESYNHGQFNYIDNQIDRKGKIDGMVHTVEADVHERRESSMLTDTDRTSLTNVTQANGDFINSFDERPNKSRWAGKDVFMFRGVERSNYVGKPSKSPERIDERGDNHKPPIPKKQKISTERNFIMEAEEKLKSFQLRRSSSHGDNITVGFCLSEKRSQSDNRLADGNGFKTGKLLGEIASDKQWKDDTENKCVVADQHDYTAENTLQEFERMEILCESEASKKSPKLPSIQKIEQEISIETDRAAGRSISRTSSMESKSSAKYHFLHDKGMIKIESPSLTLVCSSPGPTRKESSSRSRRLYEEDSTDLVESGSESDIDEIYIDDSFKLHTGTARQVSTDIESDITHNDDHMVEMEEDSDSRTIAEQQLLDEYLRTVDDGQETWDNVMKWMHKECADTEGEELEEELKMVLEQEGRFNTQEGGDLYKVEAKTEGEALAHDKNTNDYLVYSDNNQDDSIYYSFQAHSEDLRDNCKLDSLVYGGQSEDRDDVDHCVDDDMNNSLHSSSLMFTIVHGTVKDVENLLNSDRTISEAEIKEGLIWTLTNKNLPITLLLLDDICKLICAAEEGTYVDVYPGYSEMDPWNPVFIVLGKTTPVTVWDTFMGLPVYRRKYDTVSREIDIIEHHDNIKSRTITEEEQTMISEAIKQANLQGKHSKVTKVTCSTIRSKKEGKEIVSETCIAVHCVLKGFIPYGEEPIPKEINEIPTDVREGIFDNCWNKTLSPLSSNIEKSWGNKEPADSNKSQGNENLDDSIPDANNNEIPVGDTRQTNKFPGRIQIPQVFLGHVQDDRGLNRNGPVMKTSDVTTYNCMEHMNGHTVKETLEVYCESDNSEEPMDVVMNKKTENTSNRSQDIAHVACVRGGTVKDIMS